MVATATTRTARARELTADEARGRAAAYNASVSPKTGRRRAGGLSDDAPGGEGTQFADVAEAVTSEPPAQPDWLTDAPQPGDLPPELTADERRAREDAQRAEQKAKSAARARLTRRRGDGIGLYRATTGHAARRRG